MAGSTNLSSKFRGCLLGSNIGDCVGNPLEFKAVLKNTQVARIVKFLEEDRSEEGSGLEEPTSSNSTRWDSYKKDLKRIKHQLFGSLEPHTDDTVMTLCVAYSLIDNKGFKAKDMAKRFVTEYYKDPNRGYGNHVRHVFKALKKENFNDVFGPAKQQFDGNGAAMRTAPVVLYCHHNVDEMIEMAKEQSLITHTHQNGYNGAILQCLAIHQALKTDSEEEINPISFIESLLGKMSDIEQPIRNLGPEYALPYCNSLKKMQNIFEKERSISPAVAADLLGNEVSAQRSVPTAIYSFLKSLQLSYDFECSDPFARAMYHAISVRGDTDTIAAMTGSISGAYHGCEIINENFRQSCESAEKSIKAANKLYELRGGN